jgi:hypothetical protein
VRFTLRHRNRQYALTRYYKKIFSFCNTKMAG